MLDRKIKAIRLVNFQSHQDTTVEFSDGFNCIVGETNSGKTSIVRAISFALFDDWHHSYVRFGEAYTKIGIKFWDGLTMIREKGEEKNRVVFYKDEDKKKKIEFVNFGASLPDDARRILGIYFFKADDNVSFIPNISSQAEEYQLLYYSPAVKAKMLGKLLGTEVLNTAINKLNDEQRDIYNTIRSVSDENATVKIKIEEYLDLSKNKLEVDKKIKELEKIISLDNILEDLNSYKSQLDLIKQKQSKAEEFLNRFDDETFNKIIKMSEIQKELINLQEELYVSNRSLVDREKELREIEEEQKRWKNEFDKELSNGSKCPVCGRNK